MRRQAFLGHSYYCCSWGSPCAGFSSLVVPGVRSLQCSPLHAPKPAKPRLPEAVGGNRCFWNVDDSWGPSPRKCRRLAVWWACVHVCAHPHTHGCHRGQPCPQPGPQLPPSYWVQGLCPAHLMIIPPPGGTSKEGRTTGSPAVVPGLLGPFRSEKHVSCEESPLGQNLMHPREPGR